MQSHFSADHSAVADAQPALRWLSVLACGCIAMGSGGLQAQSVYRIVGTDGQVTFSDKPQAAATVKATPVDNALPAAAPVAPALPYELRQVTGKYPVTLYSSSNCAPCDSARKLLAARGVPYSEKTISTAQDAEALQKLSGSNAVPFLTIGAQHVAGFSTSEWTQYLNAAGYPESSKLPASYRQPPAAPLVTPDQPDTPAASPSAPEEPALPSVTAPAISPDNPAGIRF
ncbi:glutaredoxin domain-containing protein [Rhodoferax sp.]|uniref:glutaredoxin family protein n=1 Tax=Rhodoferax sp. TaxID=50421 RepID=UPI0026030E1B|nr:glutaredoxin domain-containing protein [Rhodoferax sp.]MDD2920268.1 glutaredoxin domain-containing protein [Rhodoferax sp.]